MPFNDHERRLLLAQKGVGKTVIAHLEEAGFSALAELAEEDAASLCTRIGTMLRSSCWHNSPLARQSMATVVALARAETKH